MIDADIPEFEARIRAYAEDSAEDGGVGRDPSFAPQQFAHRDNDIERAMRYFEAATRLEAECSRWKYGAMRWKQPPKLERARKSGRLILTFQLDDVSADG